MMRNQEEYEDPAEFTLIMKETGIYDGDMPIVDAANDRQKARAAEAFGAFVARLQARTPRIAVEQVSLSVTEKEGSVVELIYGNVGVRDRNNLEMITKSYTDLDAAIKAMEEDFVDL
jgi:hypothetical protein